jgi:hypothetical protein
MFRYAREQGLLVLIGGKIADEPALGSITQKLFQVDL